MALALWENPHRDLLVSRLLYEAAVKFFAVFENALVEILCRISVPLSSDGWRQRGECRGGAQCSFSGSVGYRGVRLQVPATHVDVVA